MSKKKIYYPNSDIEVPEKYISGVGYEDKMSHEATVISTQIQFGRSFVGGKRDRRFKSGWRIAPIVDHKITLSFTLERNERYTVNQAWDIGEKGKFGVYLVTRIVFNMVTFTSVKYNALDLVNFDIPTKIPMLYYGSYYSGEGSSL